MHKEKHKIEKPHIMETQKPDDAEDDELVNFRKLVFFPQWRFVNWCKLLIVIRGLTQSSNPEI